jgi:hypothetical protein
VGDQGFALQRWVQHWELSIGKCRGQRRTDSCIEGRAATGVCRQAEGPAAAQVLHPRPLCALHMRGMAPGVVGLGHGNLSVGWGAGVTLARVTQTNLQLPGPDPAPPPPDPTPQPSRRYDGMAAKAMGILGSLPLPGNQKKGKGLESPADGQKPWILW